MACLALFALPLAVAPAALAASNQPPLLPRGVTLPKDVMLPNDTVVAIYVPPAELKSRTYISAYNMWAEPGKVLDEARTEGAKRLFPQVTSAVPGAEGQYGLLLATHPVWGFSSGNLRLELRYRVFDPAGKLLREGSNTQTANVNAGGTLGGFRTVTGKAMQMVMIDLLRELKPSAAKFPATGQLATVSPASIARRDRPVSTGTGFYINAEGQLLTAAHVLRDCLVIEAKQGETTFTATQRAASDLLDVAVMDTGRPTTVALPLRAGQTFILGESVTNVGFPLSGLLANNPNVTRGNLSARGGMKGSMGLFTFSAPVQPGSSGGPVVSDGGELLGVTVGTLNLAALVRTGALPQNVNFALDAKHVASFLRRENVAFTEVPMRNNGTMQGANDAALAAVVQLSCYQ
ncbi:MAG: hypothetical protein RL026_1902 [Pseudomonadota bacterium]|jgi:S1-C subfamily serine protease